MKMLKAVKKLKFWSRKKRKRKSLEPSSYPDSSQYRHCNYSCSSTQPSAPPLPPWLEAGLTQDAIAAPDQAEPFPLLPQFSYPTVVQYSAQDDANVASETESQSYQQYMVPNPVDTQNDDAIANVVSETEGQSYQQYMVPNPAYGLPVVVQQEARKRRERSAGFLGFVIDFGVSLIRCFCPCFRIRDEVCRQL